MNPDVYGAIGVVLAAIVAYLGVRYTAQQSNRAQKVTTVMESKAIDAAAYERARDSYEAAIAQYLREQERLHARIEAANARIAVLNAEILHLEESKRDQRFDMEATVEQLVALRTENEHHLVECEKRLQRLRDRMRAGNIDVSENDPDLQLDP